MAELTLKARTDDTAKLTDAEIDATKRGLTFAMRLTLGMSVVAVVFFSLAVAGIGTTAALTAGGVFVSSRRHANSFVHHSFLGSLAQAEAS